jgi:hypothetical protein
MKKLLTIGIIAIVVLLSCFDVHLFAQQNIRSKENGNFKDELRISDLMPSYGKYIIQEQIIGAGKMRQNTRYQKHTQNIHLNEKRKKNKKTNELRDFRSKFHFSTTLNYGDFYYTSSIETALSESGYLKEEIYTPEYSTDDMVMDIFTLGMYSYGQSYAPTVIYVEPEFKKTSAALRFDLTYNLKPKFQLGFNFCSYGNQIDVLYGAHKADQLHFDINVNSFNPYVAYDITPYTRKSKCALGLRIGAGLTGNVIHESQQYNFCKSSGDSQNEYNSKIFQAGVMLNSKIDLFIGRHFSIIIADLTYSHSLNHPEVKQAQASNNEHTLAAHSLDSGLLTYGFGIGIHF